jgi:hypothetical protein
LAPIITLYLRWDWHTPTAGFVYETHAVDVGYFVIDLLGLMECEEFHASKIISLKPALDRGVNFTLSLVV